MAQEVQIPGAGTTDREMADLGQANGCPSWATTRCCPSGAVHRLAHHHPGVRDVVADRKRVETAQNRVLGSNNFSPVLVFVLIFIPLVGLISIYLIQSNLNQVWERGAQA